MPASIDSNVIAELRAMDDTGDFFRELSGLFAKNAPALLDQIRRSLAANDAKTAAGCAHQLKSSAGGLGAKGVYDICAHLEECADNGDLTASRALLTSLETRLAAALAELTHLAAEAA